MQRMIWMVAALGMVAGTAAGAGKAKPVVVSGNINAVAEKSIRIEVKAKKGPKLTEIQIDSATEYLRDDTETSVDDLRIGEPVRVEAVKKPKEKALTATRVQVGKSLAQPASAPAKSEPKPPAAAPAH